MSKVPLPPAAAHVEVFDPEFKFVKEVPASLVVHLPPARLNITRLVFCRHYKPGEPYSCSMNDGCKFVHADVDPETLDAHPIHVKYAWRHEDLCTYKRLPAGAVVRVTAPNNRPPVEEIPSERILVTQGSLNHAEAVGPLSHCAHYYFNRMCNRGEQCNFVHAVYVDENVVGDFKRAPYRRSKSRSQPSSQGNVCAKDSELTLELAITTEKEVEADGVSTSSQEAAPIVPSAAPTVRWYRHDPYAHRIC